MINGLLMSQFGGKEPVPIADGLTNTSTTKATPNMTGDTTPSGSISSSDTYSTYYAWYAFDNTNWPPWSFYNRLNAWPWISYTFPTPKPINKVIIRNMTPANSYPYNVRISGDGNVFGTFSLAWTSTPEELTITWSNATPYSTYKLEFDAPYYGDIKRVDEIILIECQYE